MFFKLLHFELKEEEEYEMKLLKLARNEVKQRIYKSKLNIVINLKVLKEQLSKDDYNTLMTITDNTKEKHFIKKKEYLTSKYNGTMVTTSRRILRNLFS